ncbi:MAG: recombination mediator RecR [Spirochaetes bacterium]|nr:recombination mediator RecR [Spirochaetota bacterium]
MNSVDILIKNLSSLPGIGKKSAARIAYYLLKADRNYIKAFANSICDAVEKIKNCKTCGNYTEDEICEICSNPGRDKNIICVVEMPQDITVIESTGIFTGQYHVLMGHISPIDGIGPDQINIKQLLQRLDKENIGEIIIATNPSVEGDTTALYIQKLLAGKEIKITKLASGLPVGGDLEYTDKLTLVRSIQGRLPL